MEVWELTDPGCVLLVTGCLTGLQLPGKVLRALHTVAH